MAEVSGAGAGLPRGILSGMPLFLDRHHLSGATHRRCCRTYPGRGRLLMKGFGEPVGVFDVGWRERTA